MSQKDTYIQKLMAQMKALQEKARDVEIWKTKFRNLELKYEENRKKFDMHLTTMVNRNQMETEEKLNFQQERVDRQFRKQALEIKMRSGVIDDITKEKEGVVRLLGDKDEFIEKQILIIKGMVSFSALCDRNPT